MSGGGEQPEAPKQKTNPAATPPAAATAVPEAVRQQDATMRMACARSPRLGLHMRQCLDSEAARVPSAQREQERTQQIAQAVIMEPGANPLNVGVANDGSMSQEGPLSLPAGLKKSLESNGGDANKAYQDLVEFGKSLKDDPNKLLGLVSALNAMLYKNYTTNPSALQTLPDQGSILQQSIAGQMRNNFACADISLFMVRYLEAIGVEAVSFMGVAMADAETARRFAGQTGHSLTVVDLGNGKYGIVGLTQNVVLEARSLEEAYALLSKRSDAFITRGTMLMYGAKNGEYYRKYILDQETLYGRETEFSSDQNLRLNTSFISNLEALSAMEKKDVVAAVKQAAKRGFRVSSISIFGATGLEGGPPDSGSRVRLEGATKGGTFVTLDFNLRIARSEERFGAVLTTVSNTSVQRFEAEVGARHTQSTALFDSSRSEGARLGYQGMYRLGTSSALGVSGAVHYERTEGQSATFEGGRKRSDIQTLSAGVNGRYIRTFNLNQDNNLDLWVGTGLQGYALSMSATGTRPGQKPTSGGSEDFDARITQTLGTTFRGTSPHLDYAGTVAFSVVEDTNLADPSTQAIGVSAGTMQQGELMVVYRPVDGVGVYGKVEAVRLQMPVNTRLLGGYKIGITLNDVGGARGLNISADWAQQVSTDYLHMSQMSADLTGNQSQVIGTRVSYFDQQSRGTLGVGARQIRNQNRLTGDNSKNNEVMVDYTLSF